MEFTAAESFRMTAILLFSLLQNILQTKIAYIWRYFSSRLLSTDSPYNRARLPHCSIFEITIGYTTIGRTPLGELSAQIRDLYLATHNKHTHTKDRRPRRNSNPQS
jgi:hypothetical protein